MAARPPVSVLGWFQLTRNEQRVILLVLAIFLLGVIVRFRAAFQPIAADASDQNSETGDLRFSRKIGSSTLSQTQKPTKEVNP